jgi:hypothetical protein
MQEHGLLGEEHAFRTFEHVVRAVTALSPLVEVQDIGTIVLSARGPSRYFGGDNAVAQKLHQICLDTNMGSAFGVGIADSRFAALAAAHLAVSRQHPCVIDTAIAAEFIAALPVASLSRVGGITADTVDLFQRLGLGTCGALLTVGEAALIDRFGVEGKRVYLLVSGDEVQHLAPGAPPSDFACSVEFESPLANAAHVVSAARDTIDHARTVARRELAAIIDNPVVVANGEVTSNGNFHGAPVAMVLDFLAIAVADVGSISERRTDRFLDVSRNRGLPPFLAHDAGVDSGLMIAQYTQAAMVSENKRLANPASVDSIPSSAMQEDHVSMGWHAGRKLRKSVDNLRRILAIELVAAARAVELRAPLKPSPVTGELIAILRERVPGMGPDRELSSELEAANDLLKQK